MDLKMRKAITKELSERYKKSPKKEKGKILDEFCYLTGYNRSYGALLLRRYTPSKNRARKTNRNPSLVRRGRKPI